MQSSNLQNSLKYPIEDSVKPKASHDLTINMTQELSNYDKNLQEIYTILQKINKHPKENQFIIQELMRVLPRDVAYLKLAAEKQQKLWQDIIGPLWARIKSHGGTNDDCKLVLTYIGNIIANKGPSPKESVNDTQANKQALPKKVLPTIAETYAAASTSMPPEEKFNRDNQLQTDFIALMAGNYLPTYPDLTVANSYPLNLESQTIKVCQPSQSSYSANAIAGKLLAFSTGFNCNSSEPTTNSRTQFMQPLPTSKSTPF